MYVLLLRYFLFFSLFSIQSGTFLKSFLKATNNNNINNIRILQLQQQVVIKWQTYKTSKKRKQTTTKKERKKGLKTTRLKLRSHILLFLLQQPKGMLYI